LLVSTIFFMIELNYQHGPRRMYGSKEIQSLLRFIISSCGHVRLILRLRSQQYWSQQDIVKQSMTNPPNPAKPTLLFPRISAPLAPSLTIPAAPNTLSAPEPSSASCKSVSTSCLSFSTPSLHPLPRTSAPFRPSITIPTIFHTLPGRAPTAASRILLSAFAEALYYSGLSDCLPCPILFRVRVLNVEHWRPWHQARVKELFLGSVWSRRRGLGIAIGVWMGWGWGKIGW